ncbi:hypothetical protein LTR84_001854 [Exophiala bonariae]|uniref:Uncharacterized protein n=1 Tax=Exophiala bonariae TaxID=1690606 RepID=A0AAV9NF89_9EURO|nr:hypothetical protein LTR84_001854 [Exophiala bonariae]
MKSPLPSDLKSKTVVVTGGANGIGAAIVDSYARLGANIVIADLPSASSSANKIINSVTGGGRMIFVPADITNWFSMVDLFKTTKSNFGRVDIVVANAGIMETKPFFDFDVDISTGDLKEEPGLARVIDVNLKGTMNSKRIIVCIVAPDLVRNMHDSYDAQDRRELLI